MPSHEEYVTKLKKLQLIEEKTLEYLAAIRLEKMLTWTEMTSALGKELKPHYSILGTPSRDQMHRDLEML